MGTDKFSTDSSIFFLAYSDDLARRSSNAKAGATAKAGRPNQNKNNSVNPCKSVSKLSHRGVNFTFEFPLTSHGPRATKSPFVQTKTKTVLIRVNLCLKILCLSGIFVAKLVLRPESVVRTLCAFVANLRFGL
jgi:hypothetical protein